MSPRRAAGLHFPVLASEVADSEMRTPPEDWMLAQRVYPIGIRADAFSRAARQADRIRAVSAVIAPETTSPAWKSAGPTNIGGRVLDIAVDPKRANAIYIATATGGVWRSTDGGMRFAASWPAGGVQAIGAIAIASDGTMFAGTGEAGPGGGSLTYGGDGIYRSTDNGKTWSLSGLSTSGAIGRIAIDPGNPKRIFVAAAGSLFVPGGERGLYRSLDGGHSWTRVKAGANGTTGCVDVVLDPQNPQRVYAAMWDHVRYPDLRRYGGKGSGIYRSTDGGATWKRLGGGLPAVSADVGRIGIAVAPSSPNRLYAIVIDTAGTLEGFYKSQDGGDAWTYVPPSSTLVQSQSSYGWWFGRVWVDLVNPDHVFVGGVSLMQSTNGGTSWSADWETHADDHAMVWDPKAAGRVYLGNDGGVYRSDTNGVGGWTSASYQPFTQFYSVDVGEQDPSRIVGGTQDNGVNRSYPGGWNYFYGGDGLAALINYQNQNLVYACYQYGGCAYSEDGGENTDEFGDTASSRRNWFTPVVFDPTNPSVMYYGGNLLNRSTDGGKTWTAISSDLTGGPGRDTNYPFGTITTVAAAKSNGSVIYIGTDDGRVWHTRDGGQNWNRVTDTDVPGAWVTRVAVDPLSADIAYATFSGYRSGDNASHVLRTADGGANWSDITADLPEAPVNDIVPYRHSIYVATDVGVFVSRNGGGSWLAVGKGLPLVPVADIRLHVPSKTLFAATFGRGIYKVRLPSL